MPCHSALLLCPADRSFVPPYIRNHHLILHLKITCGNKCSASCFTYLLGIKMYLGWEGSLTCFGWMIHASEQPVLGEAGWNSLWMHLQRHSLLNLFALWKLRFLLRIKSYGFNLASIPSSLLFCVLLFTCLKKKKLLKCYLFIRAIKTLFGFFFFFCDLNVFLPRLLFQRSGIHVKVSTFLCKIIFYSWSLLLVSKTLSAACRILPANPTGSCERAQIKQEHASPLKKKKKYCV